MADFPSIFSAGGGGASSAPAFVGVRLSNSTDITCTSGTPKRMTWDTETYDTSGSHESVTNPGRITIPSGKDGYWMIGVCLIGQTSATGKWECFFYKGGTRLVPGGVDVQVNSSQTPGLQMTDIISLVATDYIEVFANQNSGGNLDARLSGDGGYFYAHYLGA